MDILIGRPSSKLTSLLDLDGEASLCAWYSSMQLFSVSVLASILVRRKLEISLQSISLLVLPAVFLLFSMDEIVQIHEWLGIRSDVLLRQGTRAGTAFEESGIWMFIFRLPFAALFLLWAYWVRNRLFDNRSSFGKLVAGMGILLFGAVGLESVSNFAREALSIQVLFEEASEMLGATVIFWGMYDALTQLPEPGDAIRIVLDSSKLKQARAEAISYVNRTPGRNTITGRT